MKKIFTFLVALLASTALWAQEAKWGVSASELTQSGTLQQAFEAAAADTVGVRHIQLQNDINYGFSVNGGVFTLDLNGFKMTSNSYTLYIYNQGTRVTITDSSEAQTGQVVSSYMGAAAVNVSKGAYLCLDKGTYEGAGHVILAGDAQVDVLGGVYKWTDVGSVFQAHNTSLNIYDGDFSYSTQGSVVTMYKNTTTTITGGKYSTPNIYLFRYNGGTLNLSNYPTETTKHTAIDQLMIECGSNPCVLGKDICLPTDYCLLYNNSIGYYDQDTLIYGRYRVSHKDDVFAIHELRLHLDGQMYTAGDTAILTPANYSLAIELIGSRFDKLVDNLSLYIIPYARMPVTADEWTIDTVNNTAYANFDDILDILLMETETMEIQYLYSGGDCIGSGVYITPTTHSDDTALPDSPIASSPDTQKVLRNGQLIIIRDGVEYDLMGRRL